MPKALSHRLKGNDTEAAIVTTYVDRVERTEIGPLGISRTVTKRDVKMESAEVEFILGADGLRSSSTSNKITLEVRSPWPCCDTLYTRLRG
jgi:hypothetical protein